MASSLNVIALISGGKDSLFSLLHCIQHGHEIVALANLHPPSSGLSKDSSRQRGTSGTDTLLEQDDMDSFMYQTVGHSVVPFYSEALQIPLYRRAISGTAIQTSRYYRPVTHTGDVQAERQPRDETEDLVPLLREVMQAHPQANALSTGAILSTYQRTRVESVALRLGLVPISYLWQYTILPPPTTRLDSISGLLDDMHAAGCDARIIKIASGGIRENLLWEDISSPKTTAALMRGLGRFFEDDAKGMRGAVLGEGGEYETLALSGPAQLWKGGRIEVEIDKNVNGSGGTSYVQFRSARVVPHNYNIDDASKVEKELVSPPALFDQKFQTIKAIILAIQQQTFSTEQRPSPLRSKERAGYELKVPIPKMTFIKTNDQLQINNIHCGGVNGVHASTKQQMQSIVDKVLLLLRDVSAALELTTILTTSSIVSTTLLLREMSDFVLVNPIYAKLFAAAEVNPPARVTVAAALPESLGVALSLVLDLRSRKDRKGLHVQSRSYWAPANIGPYSQAINMSLWPTDATLNLIEIVHVAGQIPLIPATMERSSDYFTGQAVLALQHLWRIGQERSVDLWPVGVAFLGQSTADDRTHVADRVHGASIAWSLANVHGQVVSEDETGEDAEDDHDFDIWDVQNNRSRYGGFQNPTSDGNHLHVLPNHKMIKASSGSKYVPPLISAEVVALPRLTSIEWWSIGIAGLVSATKSCKVTTREKSFAWGSLSALSLDVSRDGTPVHTSYITYMLRENVFDKTQSVDAAGNQDYPVTTADLLDLLEISTSQTRLAQATGYIATCPTNVGASIDDNSTESPSTSSSIKALAEASLLDRPLGESSTIIPCQSVWGQKGSYLKHARKLTLKAVKHESTDHDTGGLDVTESTRLLQHQGSERLAAAFFVRVDSGQP